MTPKVWFDEQNIVGKALAKKRVPAHEVVRENVLFFHYRSDSLEIDDIATEKHKTDYKKEYADFLESKKVSANPVIELTEEMIIEEVNSTDGI